MTDPATIDETLRLLSLVEVGHCRLFVAVALSGKMMTEEEAAAWHRRLDAWSAFLRLDSSSSFH